MMGDKYTTSPWLIDPRDKPKVFSLAGFQNEHVSEKEMERTKTDIGKKIRDLGGVLLDSDCWDDSITHVVAFVDTRKEGMSEKVMGGIAAGRWVVTQRYIEKSAKAGQFLPSPHNYSSCYKDAVISSRKRYHDKGPNEGGIFSVMKKVVTVMADERKRNVYMRILAAGGATVLKEIQSPRQLYRSDIFSGSPGSSIIVLMDPEQKKNAYIVKVRNEKNSDNSLKFLHFKYVFSLLKDFSGTIEADFDLYHSSWNMSPGHNEWKRRLPTLDGGNKRPRRSEVREVVCLSDDEELEDGEIRMSDDDDDDIVAIIDDSQKPVREKPLIEEVDLDDSDDDIEVLEEKLKEARATRGIGRQYLDTKKAKATPRLPIATVDIDEEMEDIALVELERSNSPDIVEMEREPTDDEDAKSVSNEDFTDTDSDQSHVPAPKLIIDEDTYDDIMEVSNDQCQLAEIVQPSLDDLHQRNSICSTIAVPTLSEEIEILEQGSDEVFIETVEPSFDFDVAVAAQKPPVSDGFGRGQPQEDEASIRRAIEDLAASSGPSESSSDTTVGTIVELTMENSRGSDKEIDSPKKQTSSLLFSEKLKEKAASTEDSKKPSDTLKDNEREAASAKVTKKPVTEQIKPAPEPIVVPSMPAVTRVAEPLVQTEAAPKSMTGSKTDKSEKILNRILGTIVRRMTITDEGIAVGNVNARTVRFDKHGERRLVKKCSVSQVNNQIVMDFKETLNCDAASTSAAKHHSATDAITVMRRLERETSSFVQPTPFLLNCILTRLLLREENRDVRNKSVHYLDNFLLLHLNNPSRENWLHLFLSACRNCPDERTFKTFDLSNNHDTRACWSFFSGILKEVLTRITKEEDSEEDSGSIMFLDAMVKIMHRDFDYWWKHTRPKQSASDNTATYPILFYLLGGSGKNLLSNIKSSILPLFAWSLNNGSQRSTSIRKLLSMSALLLSHQDSIQGQSLVNSGLKVELATAVGRVLKEASLGSRGLQAELFLLQPSWLSAAVSRSLLSGHQVDMSRGISEVISSLASLSLGSSEVGPVMENYCHKLMAHQHAHTIFRANWHFVRNKDKEFRAFRMMNKLEEKGVSLSSRVIRLEEVAVKQSGILDSVNVIRNFSNMKLEESDHNKNESPCGALLFRMITAENF